MTKTLGKVGLSTKSRIRFRTGPRDLLYSCSAIKLFARDWNIGNTWKHNLFKRAWCSIPYSANVVYEVISEARKKLVVMIRFPPASPSPSGIFSVEVHCAILEAFRQYPPAKLTVCKLVNHRAQLVFFRYMTDSRFSSQFLVISNGM